MYRINQIKVPFQHDLNLVKEEAIAKIGLTKDDILELTVVKRSIDARKGELKYVYSVDALLADNVIYKGNDPDILEVEVVHYQFPKYDIKSDVRPIIVGAGPAGLFCALTLAENGYNPIVLERGESVEARTQSIHQFWNKGELNPQSNMQFGEGGAGTFSDGKLNTGIKDKLGRIRKVLDQFVASGAPAEISISNKPHIGTDYLAIAVKNMRERIIQLGGEVRFNTQVTSLVIENNAIKGVVIQGDEQIMSEIVVLAIGHSARDTFYTLKEQAVPMERKTFAVGVRIEHPQQLIDQVQYGPQDESLDLPAADYKLNHQLPDGRGVFTFCMCPGGYVVNAASEKDMCVTNGMSYYNRSSKNANAAILVNVFPEDFKSTDVLEGITFQRSLERKAFELGGSTYALPIQRYEDYLKGQVTSAFGTIVPETKGSTQFADLNLLFDATINKGIKEGMKVFERKIRGFSHPDALITGVESRSSSPVRITRNEWMESEVKGLFPCGEGAGYAGGIMSSAVDGIKIAEAIAYKLSQN